MTEPPNKRSRRNDYDTDTTHNERNHSHRTSHRDYPDRDRERNRHYRDRSRSRDRHSHRDYDRRRDDERNGRRDEQRGNRGGRGDRRGDRDDRNGSRGHDRHASSRRNEDRSASPRRDASAQPRHESNGLGFEQSTDITTERNERARKPAPVQFRVGGGPSTSTSSVTNSSTGGATSIIAPSADIKNSIEGSEPSAKTRRDRGHDMNRRDDEEDGEDDIIVDEDDDAMDMAAMMGFGGFGTTKQKQVLGNNVGAVRKEKKTEYRQYMNRVGGFNRPLSPGR